MGEAVDLINKGTDIFHQHDAAAIHERFGEIYAEDAELQNPMGRFRGREIIPFWEGMLVACPDLHHHVTNTIEEGDWAALEGRFEGTHTGPLRTPTGLVIQPTGRTITFEYSQIVRVENGRINKWRVYFDTGEFIRQFGITTGAPPGPGGGSPGSAPEVA